MTKTNEGWAKTNEAVRARVTMKAHPSKLVVIGVDTQDGSEHPLYDDRAVKTSERKEPHYDEAMERDIRDNGVRIPVEVVIQDGRMLVKDGRRRVLHARFAGVEHVEFFVDAMPGEGKDLFLAARRANAFRLNDSPMQQARNCMRARREWKVTVGEYAAFEGLSTAVMRQRLCLLRLTERLQALVESGDLPFSVAIQLGKLPADKQEEVYDRLVAAGNLTTAAVRREKGGDDAEEGEEGEGEGEGTEGEGEGASDTKERKEKAPRHGLTLAELRKVHKAIEAGDLGGFDEAVVKAIAVIVGAAAPSTVAGFKAAFAHVRGS